MSTRPAILIRLVVTAATCVAVCHAQPAAAPSLAALEQSATQARTNWLKLAQDLDLRVARMRPCDPAALTAIDDANLASAARMASLAAYLNAAIDQAARDTAMARQILTTQQNTLLGQSQDRTDLEQERAGIESEKNNLIESIRRKPSLGPANDQLSLLDAMVRDRAQAASRLSTSEESASALYTQLIQVNERREAALRQQTPLLEEERVRWNGFYAARLARARLECSAMGGK